MYNIGLESDVQLETLHQVLLTLTLAGHDGSTLEAEANINLGMRGSSSEHDISVSLPHAVGLEATALPCLEPTSTKA